jgi:hypothetical protein
MKRTPLLIGVAVVAGSAAAWLVQTQRALYVNGKKSAVAPIEQGAETFVPLSALKEAGADVTVTADRVSVQFTAPRTQTQVDANEGVVGEFVSNEGWRFKVTKVDGAINPFVGRGPGFKIAFEARNVSDKAQSLHGSGLAGIEVVDKEGHLLDVSATSFKDRYSSVPPAHSIWNDLIFGDPRGAVKDLAAADKLLITFKPMGSKKLKNIRIFLNP